MRLTIRGHNITLQDETRAYVERRLRFATGRFASRIRTARIVIRDANGPRGGVDKVCAIEVHAEKIAPVIATGEHEDLFTAIDLACSRLDRLLGREVARNHPVAGRRLRDLETTEEAGGMT